MLATPYKSQGSRLKSSSTTTTTPTTGLSRKSSFGKLLSKYSSTSPSSTVSNATSSRTETAESPTTKHPVVHQRQLSFGSVSSYSSDYSDTDDEDDLGTQSDFVLSSSAVRLKRRATTASYGGGDRRRIAIVQMEALQEANDASETNSSASSVRSRRGLAGLALVAPPDAAMKNFISPPSTAPPYTATSEAIHRHHRSASETAVIDADGKEANVTGIDTASEAVRDNNKTVITNSDTFYSA
ncbi:hypothetical protein CC2G_010845 [Coprinopsis cinerea AmutBmut pab1-1]|nr:hypothetical protein CC2G_010845 [Coprinopsis cinerea AmutBmut pab1-1]